MNRTALAAVGCVLSVVTASACWSDGAVATVDGAPIPPDAIEELHPVGAELDAQERAASLLLVILHRLLLQSAEEEFGYSVPRDERQKAFAARTQRFGSDVDAGLAAQGVTRERVLLEAELDVVRHELEQRLLRSGAPGVDVDAAYRTFLSTNARVCLSALRLSDESVAADVEEFVDEGGDVEAVEDAYPDAVERLDVGCAIPVQLGPGLSSVALDGEVGDVHVVGTERGAFVAAVVERDAPPLAAVRDEVLQIATETQGPDLFNAWAAGILRAADVEVAASVGRWAPTDGTGGVPTVVADY